MFSILIIVPHFTYPKRLLFLKLVLYIYIYIYIYISDQLINIEHKANHGKNIYPLDGYMGISCSNHIYVELIKMLS
jgi:hypothetical protein